MQKNHIGNLCCVSMRGLYTGIFCVGRGYDFLKELLSEKELAVDYEDEALCRRSAWVQCGMGGMNLPS